MNRQKPTQRRDRERSHMRRTLYSALSAAVFIGAILCVRYAVQADSSSGACLDCAVGAGSGDSNTFQLTLPNPAADWVIYE